MADIPLVKGQNSVFKFFLDGNEVILNTKSWNCKANVTKIADAVNGETRDRLDRVVNYFEISAECFNRDMKVLDAILSDIDNDDQSVTPLDKAGGVRIKVNDGSRRAYQCKEIVLDDFDLTASERAPRTMTKLTFRCRFFEKVKSV